LPLAFLLGPNWEESPSIIEARPIANISISRIGI